ncbi:MAG: hypothetical protein IPP94_01560 [Ignavibacteria bacterium]|nr:hypothetical protein [Ignavibacteria bacterium]
MKSLALFLSLVLFGTLTYQAPAQRNPVEKKTTVTKKTAPKKIASKKTVTKKSIAKKPAKKTAIPAPVTASSMMRQAGRPFMDTTADGLHMQVWILTQPQHRKLLGGNTSHLSLGESSYGVEPENAAAGSITMVLDRTPAASASDEGSKSLVDSMMAGTHHIMVVVKDMPGAQELPNAGATVVVISPSEKSSTVDLAPLPGRLGAGISLNERGHYHMTLSVFDNGVTITKEFTYLVR